MKLIVVIFLLVIGMLVGCTKNEVSSKPPLSVEAFDKESKTLLGVIYKLVNDDDANRVHEVALSIQSTFALDCIPVGDECLQYQKIVTELINMTGNRKFTDEQKKRILRMYDELDKTLRSSRAKLVQDWKNYH